MTDRQPSLWDQPPPEPDAAPELNRVRATPRILRVTDLNRRVRSLLPSAVRGLRAESRLTTFEDVHEGRRGLVDAVTLYLQTPTARSTSSVG